LAGMKASSLFLIARVVVFGSWLIACAPRVSALSEVVFEDIFGRRLNERGMVLVDWEGQIANPAIRILVRPPNDATFPATAVISGTEPRLYFDLPSQAAASGPSKALSFPNAAPVPVLISIFPDRDGAAENHTLTVVFTSNGGAQRTQTLAAHVIDQDQSQTPPFAVTVDFSRDQTGFFNQTARRDIVREAAEDWTYFFAGMNLDLVAAGAEQTFIWNSNGFTGGQYVTNAAAYRGFLLYAYGIDQPSPPYRSGGEPSLAGGFQTSGGSALPLKRSGGNEIEIKGNFNTLGWYLTTGDSDWWRASNLGNEQNDLCSIAHHEIGHAFVFNPAHTRFGNFKSAGAVNDAAVTAYHGSAPGIDPSDHLNGAIDRLSRKGAFGYEYYGDVPQRRWLITKLDLLVAQAIGYTLRATSAFAPLAIGTTALPRGAVNDYYAQTLVASGGIPFYEWTISAGALPGGLTLDSFTGEIRGNPTATGTFNFTVRLRDYDGATTPVTQALSIRVESTPLRIETEKSGANVLVRFTTIAGHTYRIEYKDDLPDAMWSVLAANITGTGNIVTLTDTGAANLPKRFYRALEF
jgi:hypothetical protein